MTEPVTRREPDKAAVSRALSRIESIIGADHVLSPDTSIITEEGRELEFRDPYQPRAWNEYLPAGVVMPGNVEEVQAVVRTAAELGVPIWTHGRGRNNGYGGAGTRLGGVIEVSLRRMNRILELDPELCYALVEPGVSWLQLYQAIVDNGYPLMLSVPDIGWGSVVGNSLENGITYLPNGQDFLAPCGMEVVLADGEILRTGMGAQPSNPSWNLYKRSFGPALDNLFTQSNFGIVTKMGLWLDPEPQTIMFPRITARNDADIVALVDTLRGLMLDRTISGVPCIFNTICVACTMSERSQWYDGDDPIPEAVIDHIGAELGIGRWTFRLSLTGDEAVVDHQFAKMKAAFEAIPDVKVGGEKCSPREAPKVQSAADRVVAGVPNLDLLQMARWYGGESGGHMSFSPVLPARGAKVYEAYTLLRSLVESAGFDFNTVYMATGARSGVGIVGNSFDFANEAATRNVYETTKLMVREAAKLGYGEYRAHLNFMDLNAEQYSWNNHAYMHFVERIKDAVDPAGILAPGKQGIWPRAMRVR